MRVAIYEVENCMRSIKECLCHIIQQFEVERKISPDSTVVLKPNLCSILPYPHKIAAVTDFRVVESLVELLKGECRLVIAEGSDKATNTNEAFQYYGYQKFASQGVKLVDLEEDLIRVSVPDGPGKRTVELGRAILEADYLINLPKMKTHNNTGVTLAMKNLKGCTSKKEKVKAHLRGLEQSIISYCKIICPQLNIMDAIYAMEGNGPMWGRNKEIDRILASDSMFAMDIVVSEMMGYELRELPYLTAALESFKIDPKQIKVEGKKERFNFERAPTQSKGDRLVVNHEICTMCLLCEEVCPLQAIDKQHGRLTIKHRSCQLCGICIEFCPAGALSIENTSRSKQA